MMKTRVSAVLLTGVLAVAMLVSPTAQGQANAVFAGANGRIAFTMSGSDAGMDIWTVRPDGTDLRQLTANRLSSGPRWSPSGRQVAFLRTSSASDRADLWVIRADGSGARRITTGVTGGAPAWSPDGKQLVVARPVEGGTDLYRVPLSGGVSGTRLTFSGSRGCTVSHPSWRRSLVVYDRDCPATDQLRLLDLSSGRNRLVIGTPVADGDISWPDFTADLRIMFMSCGLEFVDPCLSESVTVVNRDGTGLDVIAPFCGCESEPSARESAPAPDGSHFALVVTDPGTDGDPMTGGTFLTVFVGRDGMTICCGGSMNDRRVGTPDWQRRPT